MQIFNHNYPSDITREQFEIIRKELEGAKKQTKPRNIDLYSVFCAILYIVKGGIKWRMLPSDFPKRGIVRYYFSRKYNYQSKKNPCELITQIYWTNR